MLRRRALLLAPLLLFLSLLPVAPTRAASPQNGASRLDAIEVTGSRFASKQIVEAVGVRAGVSITRDGLQQIADKLSALGAFATVKYHFTTAGTGVRATYEVTDAAAIPVTFDNFPWFSDLQLSDALKKSVVLFDGLAPASGALVDSMDDALMKFLDAQGSHKPIPLTDKDGQVQQFHVEEGSFLVQAVEFSDPLAKSDPHIQDRLVDVVGQPFSRNKLEIFEFEQVRPVYLAHAYLQAKFGVPAVRFAAPPANPLAGAIIITAQIDPGPAYKFGGVTWNGNAGVSSADLNGVVQMQAGSPADGNEMEALWKRVLDKYEQAGYLSADIHPTPNFDAKAGTVSYTVNITEGPQYHMGNLVLPGLSVEGERRIRKALPIPADALFDKVAYQIFMDKGLKAAFNGLPVHYDKIGNFLQLDMPNSKVDLLLDFQ